jgi:hypothetical protein
MMKMKIAVLGWGSLIKHLEKNGRKLEIKGGWQKDGPPLKIEYARISGIKELTLVLYSKAQPVKTLWAYSAFNNIEEAIENLRYRERTIPENIGYFETEDSCRCNAAPETLETIKKWAKTHSKDVDAVIWTDLQENFMEKLMRPFSEDEAITYLKELIKSEPDKANEAKKYIQETPEQVVTKLRPKIREELT